MGLLIDGNWSSAWYDTKESGGHFVRDTARFRNWITDDGSAGPTGEAGFAAESGRYHLYILPLGAPHADFSASEGARIPYRCIIGAPADAG